MVPLRFRDILLKPNFNLTSNLLSSDSASFQLRVHTRLYVAMDHEQSQEIWIDEPSIENGDFVHINFRDGHPVSALPVVTQESPVATETHSFPSQLPDWSNLEVIHRNTLPPRTSFFVYDSVEDALTRDVSNSKSLSLSGIWKFNLIKSPFEAPLGFFDPKYDTAKWHDIKVPGMWQLQGYGKGPQ